MGRCEHCPVAAGLACRAESDGRYGYMCGQAAAGEPSQLGAIRALAGEPRPAFPPIARQAVNFFGAVAGHVASGLAIVPEDERARRLAICEGCPSYDAPTGRCRKCGCRMAIKARWASQVCPLGRWSEDVTARRPEPTGGAA